MAIVSGQLKSTTVNGKPRDLMNIIFDVSPSDTPFLTLCGKSDASQTLHEWQTDKLAAPAVNAALEGADVTQYAESSTTELSNRTQILTKAITVSGTAQAITQAGVDKQYNWQMAKAMKEIKKDLELALLSNVPGNNESGSTARKMRGLPTWMLAANSSLGASGAAGSASAAATAGTKRVPTQEMFTEALTAIYTAGGEPNTIMAAPDIRAKLSSVLYGTDTRMAAVEDKKAYATVSVFVSDFGTLKIVPNRVQASDTYAAAAAFLIDPEYWKVAYLRGFKESRLANTGDNEKGQIVVECTLEARNPESSGMVADLKKA